MPAVRATITLRQEKISASCCFARRAEPAQQVAGAGERTRSRGTLRAGRLTRALRNASKISAAQSSEGLSQNRSGWKSPLRTRSPAVVLDPQPCCHCRGRWGALNSSGGVCRARRKGPAMQTPEIVTKPGYAHQKRGGRLASWDRGPGTACGTRHWEGSAPQVPRPMGITLPSALCFPAGP